MKDILSELKERGYIEQTTDDEKLRKQLMEEPTSFYMGIDPTANSMHIGHFVALKVA